MIPNSDNLNSPVWKEISLAAIFLCCNFILILAMEEAYKHREIAGLSNEGLNNRQTGNKYLTVAVMTL